MADVDININDRVYRISCKDGEEHRIKLLADKINNEVKLLVDKIGQLGEARMILLASLVLLDKADEQENDTKKLLGKIADSLDEVVDKVKET
tara:strand:- start:5002 stop:5277 length:276 start_codon:yes stop_codon:yes gene_type:complete